MFVVPEGKKEGGKRACLLINQTELSGLLSVGLATARILESQAENRDGKPLRLQAEVWERRAPP